MDQQNGILDIQTNSGDPFLVFDLIDVRPQDVVLEMECFATEGIRRVELFLGPPFSPKTRTDMPSIPVSETWSTYTAALDAQFLKQLPKPPTLVRIDLGKKPNVRIQIRGLHFRPLSPAERKARLESDRIAKAREERAAQIEKYLKKRFADRIDTVVVSKDKIALAGKKLSNGAETADLQIIECLPSTDITNQTATQPVSSKIKENTRTWETTFPRFDGKRDRLQSSWRLAIGGKWISSRRFPTTIEVKGKNFVAKRPDPPNQKGLGGIHRSGPLEELPELGITAITVNVVLNPFLSNRPGPGCELIEISDASAVSPTGEANVTGGGKRGPVYFNPAAFKPLDVVINFARKNNMVVSAILLIARPKQETAFAPLAHPEADGGIYTMPNLTNERSTQLYGYVLNRLTRRYSNPNKAPGGVTNWIAHNEIDRHKQWTNMGTQPRALVTESYYRSMRMINAAARTYNPHARVFVSLTHSWNVADDGQGDRLAPRDVITALQKYSIIEGDFPWGVAYHPYPQSLFSEIAWNDKIVTDDFDTPMITIQNIELLEKFLAGRMMLDSARKPRAILLSEQGFHSKTYDAASQANQAGSIVYAMSKIAKLKTVESFHYHRWIDNPNEGGLKMGLRTLPTKGKPHGEKKRAWHVYQAIGTPQEKDVTRGLPGPNN